VAISNCRTSLNPFPDWDGDLRLLIDVVSCVDSKLITRTSFQQPNIIGTPKVWDEVSKYSMDLGPLFWGDCLVAGETLK
jgi:hypothetical protein